MVKRQRRNVVAPRSGGKGRWALVVIAVAALGFGWWVFAGKSDSRVRKVCLDKVSVVVDRIDELSQAWADRNAQKPGAKSKSQTTSSPKPKPAAAPQPAPPSPAPAVSSPKTQPGHPPEDEITPEDQKELRELLRSINKPE